LADDFTGLYDIIILEDVGGITNAGQWYSIAKKDTYCFTA